MDYICSDFGADTLTAVFFLLEHVYINRHNVTNATNHCTVPNPLQLPDCQCGCTASCRGFSVFV